MTVECVIDRIEGTLSVLEWHGGTIDWPVELLPKGSREGSRVSIELAPVPDNVDAASDRLTRLRARTPQTGDIDL
jgi:hypothetical protein